MNLKIALGILAAIVVIDGVLYASYQGDYNKMNQLKKEISEESQNITSLEQITAAENKEVAQKKNEMDKIKTEIDKLKQKMDLEVLYPATYNQDVNPYNTLINQYNALRGPYNELVNRSNADAQKYNWQTIGTNLKINSYNELAKKTTVVLVPNTNSSSQVRGISS